MYIATTTITIVPKPKLRDSTNASAWDHEEYYRGLYSSQQNPACKSEYESYLL
jgi:hypothetical protein